MCGKVQGHAAAAKHSDTSHHPRQAIPAANCCWSQALAEDRGQFNSSSRGRSHLTCSTLVFRLHAAAAVLQTVFAAGSITRGSIYILLNAIIPLPWLVGWAARNMPDKRITQLIQVWSLAVRGVHTHACRLRYCCLYLYVAEYPTRLGAGCHSAAGQDFTAVTFTHARVGHFDS